jgi:molecular chaperone DnaK
VKKDALSELVQALSVKMYEQAAAAQQTAQGQAGQADQPGGKPGDDIVDAEIVD